MKKQQPSSTSTTIASELRGPLQRSGNSIKSRKLLTTVDRSLPELFALCTSDGLLKLQETDRVVWELQVDHELFALNIMDIDGDGNDEIIACALDGMTCIL